MVVMTPTEQAELTAGLPTAAIHPFLVEAIAKRGAMKHLAADMGVSERLVRRMLTQASERASLDFCDKLSMVTDVDLPQLTDAARQWAVEHDDSWPEGY
jgi:AraC-like DNA-binding protein